jgi:hypothetical protein
MLFSKTPFPLFVRKIRLVIRKRGYNLNLMSRKIRQIILLTLRFAGSGLLPIERFVPDHNVLVSRRLRSQGVKVRLSSGHRR